jgi:hypothetical protein
MKKKMKVLRYHSASVHISTLKNSRYGVMEVSVWGPLLKEAFNHFRPDVLEATKDAPAVVVRLDTALDVMVEPPQVSEQIYRLADPPPQAVVTHAKQYELWAMHARNLAHIGISRAVFISSQLELAYRWSESQAMLKLAQRRRPT